MLISSLALLFLSLLAFLASTRQIARRWRGAIWVLGAGFLGGAAFLAVRNADHTGLFAVLSDLERHWRHPAQSLLWRTLNANWVTVGAPIISMLDVFLLLAALIAIICLIAFVPGDTIERAIRPVNIALIGAIGGGLLALALVGVGLGGTTKRRAYAGIVRADDIIDGDTIRMGDVSLRLWGIDAPEMHQPCTGNDGLDTVGMTCGEWARKRLIELIGGALVVCTKPDGENGKLQETFGRPLVRCVRQSDGLDFSGRMVRDGCASPFYTDDKPKTIYLPEDAQAKQSPHHACPQFLRPDKWRDHKGAGTSGNK